MKVRTRIAPSPTGYPHIGTIWQALINFAYARRHQGEFIVRVEDTDQQRCIPEAEQRLFKALAWFGLTADESPVHGGPHQPYRQSERLELYKQYAHQLVDGGDGYYCFCSQDRLAKVRKKMAGQGKVPMYDRRCRQLEPEAAAERVDQGEDFVIRLKVPEDQTIVVNDLLRGKIEFDSNLVDDQVLLKSDGFPTYHLGVAVDDHLMKISHMVRGEEWLSSAPKLVLLYQFFGWTRPVMVHTPLLRNPDKSKLSKRQAHTNVRWYRDQGYLPEAILNFLALLGWSHPQEKTTFPLKEFIKHFDFKDLSVAGPVVDIDKLDYLNRRYLAQKSDKQLIQLIKEKLEVNLDSSILVKLAPLLKERLTKLSEVNDLVEFLVKPVVYRAEVLIDKGIDQAELKAQLEAVAKQLSKVEDWSADNLHQQVKRVFEQGEYAKKEFYVNLYLAVEGRPAGLPLFSGMEILGKQKTLKRLTNAQKKI